MNPIEDPRYDDHASLSKHPSIREDDDGRFSFLFYKLTDLYITNYMFLA